MNPTTKTELISIVHTFIAVLGAAIMANASMIDPQHLSKDVLVAFGVALLRSVTKTMWNTYFPTVDNSLVTTQQQG
jgi:ABC-type enterochelin transport system permease subunit